MAGVSRAWNSVSSLGFSRWYSRKTSSISGNRSKASKSANLGSEWPRPWEVVGARSAHFRAFPQALRTRVLCSRTAGHAGSIGPAPGAPPPLIATASPLAPRALASLDLFRNFLGVPELQGHAAHGKELMPESLCPRGACKLMLMVPQGERPAPWPQGSRSGPQLALQSPGGRG